MEIITTIAGAVVFLVFEQGLAVNGRHYGAFPL